MRTAGLFVLINSHFFWYVGDVYSIFGQVALMLGKQGSGQGRLFYGFDLGSHVPQDHLLPGILLSRSSQSKIDWLFKSEVQPRYDGIVAGS